MMVCTTYTMNIAHYAVTFGMHQLLQILRDTSAAGLPSYYHHVYHLPADVVYSMLDQLQHNVQTPRSGALVC